MRPAELGLRLAVLALLAACTPTADAGSPDGAEAAAPTPAEVAEALLAADRAFAEAAAGTDLVSALTAMFADGVVMPTPAFTFAEGVEEATRALEADALNRASRAIWAPIRAGVSADGRHGFTFGYMTVHRPDSSTVAVKYLAYWIGGPDGWRVAAYKRGLRADEPVDTTPMAPSLPNALVAPVSDEAVIAAHRESLIGAERAFSDEAQEIGLGAAFARHGSADAVNMGGGTAAWVVGAEAIGASLGARGPETSSPVTWAADHGARVASSGDLGVTFGWIRSNEPAPGAPVDGFPFFTIWRRAADGVWRYIAE